MRDVDDRDAEIVAQRLEQVDDRHAQRGVDHRDRLVGDDQRRARRSARARSRCAAAGRPTARAGSGPAPRRATARPCAAPRRPCASTSARAARVGEAARGHEQIAVDALQRIERLERVLEDRLHLPHEGEPLAPRPRMRRQSRAAEADRAAGRRHHVQDHAGERGLAAARLADDGEDLRPAGVEREADVVDRLEVPARQEPADRVGLADMIDLEQRARSWRRLGRRREAGDAVPRRDRDQRRVLARGRCPWRAGSADGSGSRAAARRGWAARPRAPCFGVVSPMRGRLAMRCAV